MGRIISSQDTGGIVRYNLRADGQMQSIQTNNNTINLQYDDLGRLILESDPTNNIVKSYAYDSSMGWLKKQSQNGDSTIYNYDLNGLVTTKKIYRAGNLKQSLLYAYNSYKQPIKIIGPRRRSTFYYDDYGRNAGYLDTIKSVNVYKYSYRHSISYNGSGLVSEIQHGIRTTDDHIESVVYENREYTDGIQTQILVDNSVVWEYQQENEMGMLTQAQVGGTSYQCTYNPIAQLTSFQYLVAVGDTAASATYSYNSNGDMIHSSIGRPYNKYEDSYTYDALNRLLTHGTDPTPHLYQEGTGNLLRIPGVSQMEYAPGSFVPSSVTILNNDYTHIPC